MVLPLPGTAMSGRSSRAGRVCLGSIMARSSAAWSFEISQSERDIDAIAVAEIGGAVGIGELHRFDLQVQGGGRAIADPAGGIALQDVEHLDQMNAAG